MQGGHSAYRTLTTQSPPVSSPISGHHQYQPLVITAGSFTLDGINQWPLHTNNNSNPNYQTRVLFLCPEKDVMIDFINKVIRVNSQMLDERCHIYIQEITADKQIQVAIERYNPAVIVTTGGHWMQLILSGFCPERRISTKDLQDVERIHGSMLQVSVCGAMRYLFPLVGYTTTKKGPSPPSSPHKVFSCPQLSRLTPPSPMNNDSAAIVIPEISSSKRRSLPGRGGDHQDSVIDSYNINSSSITPLSLYTTESNSIESDLNNLILFLSQQIESMTPPSGGGNGGSPPSSSGFLYDSIYGSRRISSSSILTSAASILEGRQQQQLHYSSSSSPSPSASPFMFVVQS